MCSTCLPVSEAANLCIVGSHTTNLGSSSIQPRNSCEVMAWLGCLPFYSVDTYVDGVWNSSNKRIENGTVCMCVSECVCVHMCECVCVRMCAYAYTLYMCVHTVLAYHVITTGDSWFYLVFSKTGTFKHFFWKLCMQDNEQWQCIRTI